MRVKYALVVMLVVMFLATAMASTAFAAKAVVGSVDLLTGRALVQEKYQSAISSGLITKHGYSEVAFADAAFTKDQAASAGTLFGADKVYQLKVHTLSDQHWVSGKYLLDAKRIHKGKCWIEGWSYDVATGQFTDIKTDPDNPWAVQPGDKMNSEIVAALEIFGGLIASDHIFANDVLPYAFSDHGAVRGVGYVAYTVGVLAGSLATPAESAAHITGQLVWARDILPHAWNSTFRYVAGGSLMAVPLMKAHGIPDNLELAALTKGATNLP